MITEDELLNNLTTNELNAWVDTLNEYSNLSTSENSQIILYTTHCPQCRGIELLLKAKHIPYIEVTDVDEMLKLNIKSTPVLSVDNKLYLGKDIHKKINELSSLK